MKRKANYIKPVAVGNDCSKRISSNRDGLYQSIPLSNFINLATKLKSNHPIKVEAIKEMGFENFVHIDFPKIDSKWPLYLLTNFEVDSSSLVLPTKEKIFVSAFDFHCVYGLPRGVVKVRDADTEDEKHKFDEFMADLRKYWGISNGSPTVKQMIGMLENKQIVEKWRMNFIIFAVNCFIVTNQNSSMKYDFMFSPMEVGYMKQIDWCDFAKVCLLKTVTNWNENRRGRFTGPLPFLMIFYWDRVRKEQMGEIPRTIPLSCVWKNERIAKHMTLEMKSGFGVGNVLVSLGDVTQETVKQCYNTGLPKYVEHLLGDDGDCDLDTIKKLKIQLWWNFIVLSITIQLEFVVSLSNGGLSSTSSMAAHLAFLHDF